LDKIDLSLLDLESHYYITGFQERLNGLANYFAIMSTQVACIESEQSKQLKKDLENVPDSWSDADQYSFIQWRENEYQQFKSTFAENFRYSFIVLVWLVIEDELKRVCVEVKRRKGLQNGNRPREISQCKQILKEVGGFDVKNSAHWSGIDDLRKIRNCIVHTSGFVDDSIIERLNLQIDDDKRLRVSTEYCELAVQSTTEFFAEVLDGVGIKRLRSLK